jgi:hypothetical protein
LLMLRVRFQVSVGIPSTTLGGVECHNSSGAQHRAYCSTNDCVVGDRQERLNEVLGNAIRRRIRFRHCGLA